jgi:hypothetical protein
MVNDRLPNEGGTMAQGAHCEHKIWPLHRATQFGVCARRRAAKDTASFF